MIHLSPCPACSRHVRARSTECPFCEAALEPGFEAPIYRTPGRVGRAALLAFRAVILGAAGASVGCGAATGLDGLRIDAEVVTADAGTSDAGPSERPDASFDAGFDGGFDAGSDAGFDAGSSIALYGGPVPVPSADAGSDAGGDPLPVPAYGAPSPIFDGGSDAGAVQNLYGGPPMT